MERSKPTFLIVDANVLIDYCMSDRSVLSLVSRFVGRLQVVRDVLKEVDQLGEEELVELGIELIEPSMTTILKAEATKGSISFEDRLCFLLAKANDWTFLSNDRALRKPLPLRRPFMNPIRSLLPPESYGSSAVR